LTARQRQPQEQAELNGHEVISRTRRAVPRLATESLVRIHGLLERALAGEVLGDAVLIELARTLGRDA
jgi:hypothetical protein